MEDSASLVQRFAEKDAQRTEEIQWLKDRLDISLNTVSLQIEEIQNLKDEMQLLIKLR